MGLFNKKLNKAGIKQMFEVVTVPFAGTRCQ